MRTSVIAQMAGALATLQTQFADKFDFTSLEGLNLPLELQATLRETVEANFGAAERMTAKSQPLQFVRRDDWEVVATSPQFPNHQIRIKNPEKLGVDKVKQWSGYIDVLDEDKHFFFWFFESRNDPENDPVVMWLNGGPGCSSSTGQFFELGPSSIDANLTLHTNPFSWNNKANLFFLDQPVNVGYSYSEDYVDSTALAAKDVYAFLSLFFEEFPQYAGRDFHIAGESYGGHYLPAIGYEILQHEDRNFNLTSVLIGNGIVDAYNQAEAQVSMACGEGGYPSVVEPEVCDAAYRKLPRCQELIQACYDTDNQLVCVGSSLYCAQLSAPYEQSGRNVYDIREECGDECYPQLGYIERYLNQEHVQEALGVEAINFVGCDSDVGTRFAFHGDLDRPFQGHVASILEADVPVLIYAGDKDWICNWLGNQEWTNKLDWYAHDEFASAELEPWYVDGKQAGEVKSVDGLTFLRVYDAGHMVPFNKPKQSLVFLDKWLAGDLALES